MMWNPFSTLLFFQLLHKFSESNKSNRWSNTFLLKTAPFGNSGSNLCTGNKWTSIKMKKQFNEITLTFRSRAKSCSDSVWLTFFTVQDEQRLIILTGQDEQLTAADSRLKVSQAYIRDTGWRGGTGSRTNLWEGKKVTGVRKTVINSNVAVDRGSSGVDINIVFLEKER